MKDKLKERWDAFTTDEKMDRLFNAIRLLATDLRMNPNDLLIPSKPEEGDDQNDAG